MNRTISRRVRLSRLLKLLDPQRPSSCRWYWNEGPMGVTLRGPRPEQTFHLRHRQGAVWLKPAFDFSTVLH